MKPTRSLFIFAAGLLAAAGASAQDAGRRISIEPSGRFQHDFIVVEADQGNHRETNVRRLRIGPRVRIGSWLIHAEADLNLQEADPVFTRLTDAYVQWRASDRAVLTAGKHSIPFTLDGATSSKELLTIDRNNLTNNLWFAEEYLPGASVAGAVEAWSYRGGLYSAGSANKGFGRFDGGAIVLASIARDLADRLGIDRAALSTQYVYQQADADNSFTRPFGHVLSVNVTLEQGRWGVRGDVAAGAGYGGQSNVRGVVVMPYYGVTTRLQLVGRYTLVQSSEPNGVRLGTYENRIATGRGDGFHEGYAGANYYFFGHRLKVQTGLQVARMVDAADDGGAFAGVSWVTGVRAGWP